MYRELYKVIKAEEKDLKKILNKIYRQRYKKIAKRDHEEASLFLFVKEDFAVKTGKVMTLALIVRVMNGNVTVYKYKTKLRPHTEVIQRFEGRIPYIVSQGRRINKDDENEEII